MSGREMEPIAIIGIGCRFPRAGGPDAFWRLLRDGVDAVGEIPRERWNSDLFYDPDPAAPGKTNTRWAALLDRVDHFDCHFFKISPREAAHMDPQQRLLLEVAWEALEDAGCPPDALAGTPTGVFAGIMFNDYGSRIMNGDPGSIDSYTGSGNIYAITANRISYALDLHGPSLAVDTACSSSLVAVHLACRSLRDGECELALAGGVNVILSVGTPIYYTRAGLMARDGRCKTFDARADGFVRGEGAGMVVLKPLAAALRDGDPVHAVIRGSAVNHDGRGNGLTAPNRWAQEAVIREAYKAAGVAPSRVDYVEAHGSGTSLGDPIELKALGAVLAEGRPASRPCAVGSVKTNIGHLEAAAGIAGLIKTVLCVKHREIPPSLHFETPNPYIPFADLPLQVQSNLGPWPAGDGPAIAGVSSFGFGGANAHLVIEEAPAAADPMPAAADPSGWILPLSARHPQALASLAESYLGRLASGGPEDGLADLCATAAVRRSHHDYRLALSFRSREEAAAGLAAFLEKQPAPGVAHGRRSPSRRRKVAFAFSGQGPQWWAMGRQLLAAEPVFRAAVERCDELVRERAGWSLLAELTAAEEHSRLEETWVAQPAIFALQVGLAALWRSWGIEPDAVVGHSVGEVAAACVSGCLSLEDAVWVVCHRGRLMHQATGLGRMASIDLAADEVAAAIAGFGGRLSIAAFNGPASTVVSGETTALTALLEALGERGVACRTLRGAYAFHSPQMEPFRESLTAALAGLRPAAGSIPFVPTATVNSGEGCDAAYWGRQIAEPVRFTAAMERLLAQGCDTFVEIGPHPVLAAAISECLHHAGREGAVLPSLRRAEPERVTLLASLGRLYALGCAVSWKGVYPAPARCVPLPAYPWQQERCWVELAEPLTAESPVRQTAERQEPGRPGVTAHPFAGRHVEMAYAAGLHLWETELDLKRLPYLEEHRVQGQAILPAAAYLEMMLEAADCAFGTAERRLAGLSFERPLALPATGAVALQVVLEPGTGGDVLCRVYGRRAERADARWTLHVSGRIVRDEALPAAEPGIEAVQARCAEMVDGAGFYRKLGARGNGWGPAFQGIERIWRGPGEALARIVAPEVLGGGAGGYHLHPALLDACFQVLAATQPLDDGEDGLDGAFVGAGAERVWVAPGPLPALLWSHARARTAEGGDGASLVGDLRIADAEGAPRVVVEGVRFHYLASDGRDAAAQPLDDCLYEIAWKPAAEGATRTSAFRPATWLLLADAGGVAEALALRLAETGDRPVLVRPDEEPADLRSLLREALDAGRPCRGLIHLRSLDAAPSLEAAHRSGSGSVLRLVRELAELAPPGSPRLWLATRGAQKVVDGEAPEVAQAALWGFGRAVAEEHPALWGGLVDLDPAVAAADAAAVLLDVVRQTGGEDQVAFRGGRRFVPRLVRADGEPAGRTLSWRTDGTYLITGGLGDLGLLVARWMVAQGARRLILLGRTPLPPRALWGSVETGTAAARRCAAIRELEALGASVHLAAVDVADEAALAAFLDAFRSEGWPPVRGVVHAAGVAELRLIHELDEAALERAFRPKVAGAWLLHRLLADAPLDFFVLFSSVSALHGTFGQGLAAYAAANASLDALAHLRAARGLPALSIGWGAWGEVGMAARLADGREGRSAPVLAPAEGLELLGRLLPCGAAHVAALRADWSAARNGSGKVAPLLSLLSAAEAAGQVEAERPGRRMLLAAPIEERERLLLELLRRQVAQVLRVSLASLEEDAPLSDLGMDSLAAVEVKNWAERSLGVALPMVQLLSGPSLAELAARMADRLAAEENAGLSAGPAAEADNGALGHGQRALWFLHQVEPESSAYNVAFAARIRSAVDVPALRQAFQALVDRHASLRTRFVLRDGQPARVVEPEMAVGFAVIDAAALGDEALRARLDREYRQPFDLERGPLLRAALLTRSAADHVLLLAAHHIAVDGWSLFLLLDELRLLYGALRTGAQPPLPPLAAEYGDYVRWQQEMLAGPEGERQWEFWRRQLAAPPPVLTLPFDRPRPAVQTYRGGSVTFVVGDRVAEGLRLLAREEGATLFMALLALFQVLLHRASGQGEVAVGSSTAGRSRADFAGVVGHFVNPVVLRGDLSANPPFRSFLRQVRGTALAAFDHQDYPFPLLVERLQPGRDARHAPFFQASFVLQNLPGLGRLPEFLAPTGAPVEPVDFGGLALEPFPIAQQEGQHDLELEVYERTGSLAGVLQYNTDLFDAGTVATLAARFRMLAASAVAQPDARVADLEMMTEDERRARAIEETRRRETDLQRLKSSRRRGVSLTLEGAPEIRDVPSLEHRREA